MPRPSLQGLMFSPKGYNLNLISCISSTLLCFISARYVFLTIPEEILLCYLSHILEFAAMFCFLAFPLVPRLRFFSFLVINQSQETEMVAFCTSYILVPVPAQHRTLDLKVSIRNFTFVPWDLPIVPTIYPSLFSATSVATSLHPSVTKNIFLSISLLLTLFR